MDGESFCSRGHTVVSQTVDNHLIHNILSSHHYSPPTVCESWCVTRFSPVTWQSSTSALDVDLVWCSTGATVCCTWPFSLAWHSCHTLPHCYYERWNALLRLYKQRYRRHCPRWRAAPKRAVIVLGSFRPGSTGGSFGQLAAFFFFFFEVSLLPARSLATLN